MATSSMALFEETGAYLHGHFRLTSGMHSGEYLQCAKVLAHPQYAERLGRALSDHSSCHVGPKLLVQVGLHRAGRLPFIDHEEAAPVSD